MSSDILSTFDNIFYCFQHFGAINSTMLKDITASAVTVKQVQRAFSGFINKELTSSERDDIMRCTVGDTKLILLVVQHITIRNSLMNERGQMWLLLLRELEGR